MYVMNDERKNAEGYMDLTAYDAIKRTEEEEERGFRKGDIYEYSTAVGVTRYALIVSANERNRGEFLSIIVLHDEEKGNNSVPVELYGIMFANCDCVSYGHNSKFERLVGNATESEMKEIEAGIRRNFGLKVYDTGGRVASKDDEIKALNNYIDRLKVENMRYKECANAVECVEQDAVKLMTERDLYKAQYEMLLERLISR